MIKRVIQAVEILLVVFILIAIGWQIHAKSFNKGFENGVLYGGVAILAVENGFIPPPPDYLSDSEMVEYITKIARQQYESSNY